MVLVSFMKIVKKHENPTKFEIVTSIVYSVAFDCSKTTFIFEVSRLSIDYFRRLRIGTPGPPALPKETLSEAGTRPTQETDSEEHTPEL